MKMHDLDVNPQAEPDPTDADDTHYVVVDED